MDARFRVLWTILLFVLIPLAVDAGEGSRPYVVAHRGLLLHAPENTLANFRACLELRIGFEFDVQRTKDGQLICLHDDTLNRTTNGTGRVADHTLAEIRGLDAGSWFDSRFAGEKVPTVEEVLKLLADQRDRDVLVAVDLKAADVGVEVVRQAEKLGVLQRLLFIGKTITEPTVREQIKRASLVARTAVVVNHPDEFQQALGRVNTDWIYFRFIPTRDQIEAVQGLKKRSFIAGATVAGNLPENWRQATRAGVDAILTDFPFELQAGLRPVGKQ